MWLYSTLPTYQLRFCPAISTLPGFTTAVQIHFAVACGAVAGVALQSSMGDVGFNPYVIVDGMFIGVTDSDVSVNSKMVSTIAGIALLLEQGGNTKIQLSNVTLQALRSNLTVAIPEYGCFAFTGRHPCQGSSRPTTAGCQCPHSPFGHRRVFARRFSVYSYRCR